MNKKLSFSLCFLRILWNEKTLMLALCPPTPFSAKNGFIDLVNFSSNHIFILRRPSSKIRRIRIADPGPAIQNDSARGYFSRLSRSLKGPSGFETILFTIIEFKREYRRPKIN